MIRICVVVFVLLAVSGCSRERQMGRVTGTVSYHGKPVTSGIVQFQSASGPMATGGIDANGNFTLTTKITGDGAWEGQHRVIVVPFIPSAADLPPGKPYPNPVEIPKRYRELDTTPLTADVVPNQVNEFKFDLVD